MACLNLLRLTLFILLVLSFTVPAESKDLVNATGFSLTLGESRVFYQGYVLTLKAVSSEGDRVWLQLTQGNQTVKNEILGKGDRFSYNKTINYINQTILDVQIDNIYAGADNYLVSFYPAYYLESGFSEPTPSLRNDTPVPTLTPQKPGQPILYIFGFLVILFILVRLLRTLR